MTHHRIPIRTLWPWLLIIIVALAFGPLLSACAPSGPAATPTPTRTPRPAQVTNPTPGLTEPPVPGATLPVASPAAAGTPSAPAKPVTTPMSSAMTSPDFAVQAFLWWRPEVADRDLGLIQDAGFHWVKQLFSWQDIEGAGQGQYDWSRTDRIVDEVQKHNLKLLVRVSSDPDKPFWGGQPPANADAYARFVGEVAKRYAGRIQAYQVWNEPNLAREWGNKRPDPAGYARVLKAAYSAIKTADPKAIVITAGMAPTSEDSDRAMPDMKFYQGIYDAMGGKSNGYFDMLGAHAAGYAVAPETDPQVVVDDPKLHNNDPSKPEALRVYAFRHVEDVRALMVRNGDTNKQIAILEFGWTTDNRPNSDYYWHGAGAGIDETTQGKYLVRAFKYAAEHWKPWVGIMTVIYMPDANWAKTDEQYYWSIIGPGWPDNFWRAAYIELGIYFNGLSDQRFKWDPNQ